MNYPTLIIRALLCVSTIALGACVSFEPRQLAPSISLSAEQIELGAATDDEKSGIDFGFTVTSNESDSLTNVVVLPGLRVRTVAADGPAALAGLRAGDVILAVDGTATNTTDALEAIASRGVTGQAFRFEVRRNTTVLEAIVSGREYNNATTGLRELYRADPIATRAGYRSEMITVDGQPDQVVAVITEFFAESPLPAAGLQTGDMILAIDGQPVGSAQGLVNNFNSPFEPGRSVMLTVFRSGELLQLPVRLWDPGRRISRLTLGPLMHYESSLNPDRSNFSFLDFWLFSAYNFTRTGSERQHRLLGIFRFSSDYGALVEESLP